MSNEGARDFREEQLQQAPEAETEQNVQEHAPISPTAAAAALSRPLNRVQRVALVQSMGHSLSNKAISRMVREVQRDTDEGGLGVQRRSASSGLEGGPLESELAQQVQEARPSGQPLGDDMRSEMEGKIGADLSPVRVHTGPTAQRLNDAMGAKAFTSGRDVFLGANADPGDKNLMAHELTHTVQQGMSEEAPSSIGAADTDHEKEAENTAAS